MPVDENIWPGPDEHDEYYWEKMYQQSSYTLSPVPPILVLPGLSASNEELQKVKERMEVLGNVSIVWSEKIEELEDAWKGLYCKSPPVKSVGPRPKDNFGHRGKKRW